MANNKQHDNFGVSRPEQKRIAETLAKLKVPAASDGQRRAAADGAEDIVGLMRKKELIGARDAMERSRDQLRGLAGGLPEVTADAVQERDRLAEKARRAGEAKAAALGKEQKTLEDEVRRVLAELAKPGRGAGQDELPAGSSNCARTSKRWQRRWKPPAQRSSARNRSRPPSRRTRR